MNSVVLPSGASAGIASMVKSQTENKPDTSKSPGAQYSSYHLIHGPAGSSSNSSSAPSGSADPITQLYDDLIKPTYELILKKLGMDAKDLIELIKNPNLDQLRTLAADLLDTIISVARQLVDGIFKFAEDMIKDIKPLLNQEVNIPIIGALWDFITTLFGDEEDFTLLNAMASIPSVTVAKVAVGTTPDQFNQGFDAAGFPQKLADEIQQVLGGTHKVLTLKKTPSTREAAILAAAPPPGDNSGDNVNHQPAGMHYFSYIEGFAGPVVSGIGTVLGLASSDEEGENWSQSGVMKKAELITTLITTVLSIPMPGNDQIESSYILRLILFAIQAVSTVASAVTTVRGVEAEAFAKLKGMMDVVVGHISLVISIIVDVVIEHKYESDIIGDTALDLLSAIGGIIQGVLDYMGNANLEAKVIAAGLAVACDVGAEISAKTAADEGDSWQVLNANFF